MTPPENRAGAGYKRASIPISGRRLAGLACLLISAAVTSCDSWPSSHLKVPPVSREAYQEYRLEIEDKKNVVEPACVVIDGQDIQLPMSPGLTRPQENRTYSFYVWAYIPGMTNSLKELWANGTFYLDVVGVRASIDVPNYRTKSGPPKNLLASNTNNPTPQWVADLESRNILEIRVRSKDITGSFTIVAMFPDKYQSHGQAGGQSDDGIQRLLGDPNYLPEPAGALPNPWGARRDVKVYNGDLRTHIEMADEREVQSAFGNQFSKFFYVGRVYLRNRHPDKRMVVYTTSLEANVLLYRPPFATNYNSLTSSPKGAGNNSPAGVPVGGQEDLTSPQTNTVRRNFTNQLFEARGVLSLTELGRLLDAAQAEIPAVWTAADRRSLAWTMTENIIQPSPFETNANAAYIKRADAQDKITSYWREVGQRVDAYGNQSAQLIREAESIAAGRTVALGRNRSPWEFLEDQVSKSRRQIGDDIIGMAGAPPVAWRSRYSVLTNRIAQSPLLEEEKKALTDDAGKIYRDLVGSAQSDALSRALRGNNPAALDSAPAADPPLDGAAALHLKYDRELAATRHALEAKSGARVTNPFDKVHDIAVNPGNRALAYSENSDRQLHLDRVGYLWHETYRPMTFQAVLNALMFTYENSMSTRTVKILQAAAAIAGGMSGFGTVIHELDSDAYTKSVAIISSIFIPEVAKLVLDDLNKHIRNLGEMGMDTVVIVPPNDVVDRYIFFPKGPIFNFVDEFDVNTPAFIKRIDNDDVAVEATLIDNGVTIQGGQMNAASLVERALNEGQADASADVLKQADLSQSLQRVELANLSSRIDDILANSPAPGTNQTRTPARIAAEANVCALVRSFKVRWGEDSTGIIAIKLSSEQIDCDHCPPELQLNNRPTADLIGGVVSKAFQLPVSDIMGVWNLKITNSTTDANSLPSTNIVVKLPPTGSDGIATFTALAATGAAAKGDTEVIVTFWFTNQVGLSTNLAVTAKIHQPQISVKALEGATLASGTLTMNTTNNLAAAEVFLPIYDSEPTNYSQWKWTFPPGFTNGWFFSTNVTSSVIFRDGVHGLMGQVGIDNSYVTNTITWCFTASCGTNVIASTNLTFKNP